MSTPVPGRLILVRRHFGQVVEGGCGVGELILVSARLVDMGDLPALNEVWSDVTTPRARAGRSSAARLWRSIGLGCRSPLSDGFRWRPERAYPVARSHKISIQEYVVPDTYPRYASS
jgi:hypothetical protein